MKNVLKRLVSGLLAFTLVLTVFSPRAFAASKKVSIKLNKTSVSIVKGKTYKLKATVKGTKKKVKWKSSNKKIAIVNSSGKITAKKTGSCTITATVGSKKTTCKVKVTKKKSPKEIYLKYLDSNNFIEYTETGLNEWYAIKDVNSDGTPELIIREDAERIGFRYMFFTLNDEKIKYIGSLDSRSNYELLFSEKHKAVSYYSRASDFRHNSFYSVTNKAIKWKFDVLRDDDKNIYPYSTVYTYKDSKGSKTIGKYNWGESNQQKKANAEYQKYVGDLTEIIFTRLPDD